jgi:hypothetical protein
VDGDGTLNIADHCPFNADRDVDNADLDGNLLTGVDWQLDSDEDTVGDICDQNPPPPGPSTPTPGAGTPTPAATAAPNVSGNSQGYKTDPHPHDLLAGDPPTGGVFYHNHDWVCPDMFAVPGVEGSGAIACQRIVDSNNDGVADWVDVDGAGYQVGETVDVKSDSDGDTHTDGCEAVNGTDPLDPNSKPGAPAAANDCDGDGTTDPVEVTQGSNFTVSGIATATPTPTPTPKPAAAAECTHRVTTSGSPPVTQVDIVCHLTTEPAGGAVYDWEVVYNNQNGPWPDPALNPVDCTITVDGISSPSTWVGEAIDANGDTIVEMAKCKDPRVHPPALTPTPTGMPSKWVESTCRDMRVRVVGAATIGSPITIHLTGIDQNNLAEMTSVESPDLPAGCGVAPPTATPTATPTPPACLDRDGDTTCRDAVNDKDDDGCTALQEAALGANFSNDNWYDVFDVPVPAYADETPNGARNRKVDMGDVLAVLFYAFAENNKGPNGNGVDYDSLKGPILPPHNAYLEVGMMFDRSAGDAPLPGKVDPAGAPNGKVDMGDVLGALAQAFVVNCIGG